MNTLIHSFVSVDRDKDAEIYHWRHSGESTSSLKMILPERKVLSPSFAHRPTNLVLDEQPTYILSVLLELNYFQVGLKAILHFANEPLEARRQV
jgi:hypothetical protein